MLRTVTEWVNAVPSTCLMGTWPVDVLGHARDPVLAQGVGGGWGNVGRQSLLTAMWHASPAVKTYQTFTYLSSVIGGSCNVYTSFLCRTAHISSSPNNCFLCPLVHMESDPSLLYSGLLLISHPILYFLIITHKRFRTCLMPIFKAG